MLFGLLQNNKTLLNIEYTLYEEENDAKQKLFKKLDEEGLNKYEILDRIAHEDHAHHDHHIPCW